MTHRPGRPSPRHVSSATDEKRPCQPARVRCDVAARAPLTSPLPAPTRSAVADSVPIAASRTRAAAFPRQASAGDEDRCVRADPRCRPDPNPPRAARSRRDLFRRLPGRLSATPLTTLTPPLFPQVPLHVGFVGTGAQGHCEADGVPRARTPRLWAGPALGGRGQQVVILPGRRLRLRSREGGWRDRRARRGLGRERRSAAPYRGGPGRFRGRALPAAAIAPASDAR